MAQLALEKSRQTARSRPAQSTRVSGVNSREFTRTPTNIAARLRTEQGEELTGQVTDLSMKGLHFACHSRIALGAECQIDVLLGGSDEPSPLLPVTPQIKVNGHVTRWTNSGLAVEFTAIIGQDSFVYLQKLLQHLSQDSARIEEEIQSSSWSHTKQEQRFRSGHSFSAKQTVIRRRPGRHLSPSDSH